MPSRTMASRMIDAASLLLNDGHGSTAFRRRAVSAAYYAAFHAIAKLCADYLSDRTIRSESDYARIYRALEHGPMKQAFAQSPLKDSDKLRRIGTSVAKLQAERFKADYLPPIVGIFPRGEVQELIDLAREVVTEIEEIERGSDDCRMLAANLMFKERRQ